MGSRLRSSHAAGAGLAIAALAIALTTVGPSFAQPSFSVPAKVTRYAERLLAKYDTLPTGRLERQEWYGKMAGKPQTIDLDGDGIITLDELIDHIHRYGLAHRFLMPAVVTPSEEQKGSTFKPLTRPRAAGSEGETEESANADAAEVDEQWFVTLDANRDAQVTLLEFAPDLTPERMAQFGRIDTNGDGVIVASEAAAAEPVTTSLPTESEPSEDAEVAPE